MFQDQSLLLPAPARYFPLEKGVYEVVAGLRALGTDFGNGAADNRVFQIDEEFPRYRKNKLECRAERLGKYYATADYAPTVERAATSFLVNRLTREYPQLFSFDKQANGVSALHCALTSEELIFDREMRLVEARGAEDVDGGEGGDDESVAVVPPYASAFDALCSQVPEDVAVVSRAPDGTDHLAAIHLCSPSHWAAEDKIGKDFRFIHAPVPGIERIDQTSDALVDAMIRRPPYVRFAWGIAANERLNQHPSKPSAGLTSGDERGQIFQREQADSPFVLRVERQVLCGLPEANAAIFTIRVYFVTGALIRSDPRKRDLLRAALLSMTPESRAYKGLKNCLPELVAWLDAKA